MDFNPVILSIPLYFLLIGIELIVQQYSRKKMYRLNDAVANISCGITQQVTGVFFKVLTIGLYEVIYNNLSVFKIQSNWQTFIIVFILYDLCYYWAHRMSHQINLFWGGHSVHHQSEDYNLSVALRQSSTQTFWSSLFYIPLALMGFETEMFLLAGGFNLIYQFWIHHGSN